MTKERELNTWMSHNFMINNHVNNGNTYILIGSHGLIDVLDKEESYILYNTFVGLDIVSEDTIISFSNIESITSSSVFFFVNHCTAHLKNRQRWRGSRTVMFSIVISANSRLVRNF